MLVTELYNGQGLGNQLWSYVVTRSLALDKGLEFGIMSVEKFKGRDFMDLDFGRKVVGGSGPEGGPPISLPEGVDHYYVEPDKWYPKFLCDVRDFDPDLLKIVDRTKIEGYFQSEKLIAHRREEIKTWLKVRASEDCYDFSDENVCVLNIRGGEYKGNPDLLLTRKYWEDALKNMRKVNPLLRFISITDDVEYARYLLPEIESFHFSIGKDYSVVKNAKYLILANSSFSFFPAWTSDTVKYVIAPKYWARHNISDGFWACAFNIYSGWKWQDRDGKLFTAQECQQEYEEYKIKKKIANLPSKSEWIPPSRIRKLITRIRKKITKAASK